jgi:hypothetical protein
VLKTTPDPDQNRFANDMYYLGHVRVRTSPTWNSRFSSPLSSGAIHSCSRIPTNP